MQTQTSIPQKNVKLLLAIGVALSAYLVQFIETWVWSPAWALLVFIVVLVLDYASAIMWSLKQKKGFITEKSRKFWFQFFLQVSTLGLTFIWPRIIDLYGPESVKPLVQQLPGAAYMFMISYNFLSFIKNATLAGGYNGPVAKFLKKYIDPHKNNPKD